MKIIFSSDENNGIKSKMAHHFGRCPYYIAIDIDNNKIKNIESIKNPYFDGHAPGVVPEFINSIGANVMVSGGMGAKAIQFFNDYNIEVITGVEGIIEHILNDYLAGNIKGYQACNDSDD